MKCKYCGVAIRAYEPGTVLVEDENNGFIAHEGCLKQDREDYLTADEVLKEFEDEDEAYGDGVKKK